MTSPSPLRYLVHGLIVESEFQLPGLPSGTGSAELRIRRAGPEDRLALPPPSSSEQIGPTGFALRVDGSEATYHRPGVGTFACRAGESILVAAKRSADRRLIELALLGPVLALALEQRGRLVLHGSAAEVGGRAVMICADSGGGKSTTLAALCHRGYPLISDDLCALQPNSRGALVPPGSSRVKLWPDSVAGLGDRPESLVELHPDFDKRDWNRAPRRADAPVPLGRIYVLEEGPKPVCEPLPRGQALESLLRHWYGSRFGTALLREGGRGPHFLRCVALSGQVPVRRLARPRRLDRLDELVDLIVGDLQTAVEGESTS